jgi:nucleotide-binding universal stress UspA family protein
MIKDVLVRLDGSKDDDGRLAAAEAIAQTFDSHVRGLFLNPVPLPVLGDWEGLAAAAEQTRLWTEARERGDRIESELLQKLAQFNRSATIRRIDTLLDDFGRIVGHAARTADVFVTVRSDDATPEAESVLFESGRHLLLVPKNFQISTPFKRVVVAWKETREAARALAESLSYLRIADTVTIIVVDEEAPIEHGVTIGTEAKKHLKYHGIDAFLRHKEKKGNVAATLIAESKLLEADLLVMGGYGHSRFREWLLGGVTRKIMQSAPLPVLLAH